VPTPSYEKNISPGLDNFQVGVCVSLYSFPQTLVLHKETVCMVQVHRFSDETVHV
jgi:hypothetical protein